MRIKIVGENDCARATRGLLRQAGFAVTEFLPADAVTSAPQAGYVITVETHTASEIAFDSADSPLEAAVLRHVAQLSKLPVIVDRPGGIVHGDRELRILAPKDDPEQATAVEFGILRGLLDLAGPKLHGGPAPPAPAPTRGWLGRLLPVVAFIICPVALWALGVPRGAHAAPAPNLTAGRQGMVSLRGRDADDNLLALAISPSALYPQLQQGASQMNLALVGGAVVSSALYDSSNSALLVHCVVGCTAASGFSDNTAFSVGSTAINVMGAYYTSGSAPSISSGNAGRLRMDSNSYLYTDCVVGCSGGSFNNNADAVSTSSNNGQSAAWLYAFNGTTWDRLRDDTNKYLYVDVGNSSIAVTGTFWQSTQPVSGTVTANEGGTWTVQPGNTANTTPWLVTLSGTNSTVPASESGAWTVQPGNTANTTPWLVSLSGANSTVPASESGSWTVAATESGTWTVQPGNTANTTPWLVTLSGTNSSVPTTESGSWTVTANAGTGTFGTQDASDGATGSAVPLKAAYLGGQNASGNLTGFYVDPCEQKGRSVANINLTASGQIITGSNYTFLCSVLLVTATAQNIAFVEGTGTTCGTGTAALAGGATAATGQNWAANGGFALGSGQAWVMKTATSGDNVCLLLSGSGQASGNVTYVQLSTAN
ncbi:MAG TPA: hypothetical protein VEH50_10905 [Methylomirabilota bacterium]|nr:hypothetical protein [Methylomirabilota bacterium]